MTINLKKLYISRGWRFGQDKSDKKWYVEVNVDIDRNDWNYISTENIDYTTLSKLKDTNFPTYIPVAFKKALKLEWETRGQKILKEKETERKENKTNSSSQPEPEETAVFMGDYVITGNDVRGWMVHHTKKPDFFWLINAPKEEIVKIYASMVEDPKYLTFPRKLAKDITQMYIAIEGDLIHIGPYVISKAPGQGWMIYSKTDSNVSRIENLSRDTITGLYNLIHYKTYTDAIHPEVKSLIIKTYMEKNNVPDQTMPPPSGYFQSELSGIRIGDYKFNKTLELNWNCRRPFMKDPVPIQALTEQDLVSILMFVRNRSAALQIPVELMQEIQMLLTVKRALQYRQLNEILPVNPASPEIPFHSNVNWKKPLPQYQDILEFILENLKHIPVEDSKELYAIGSEFIIFKSFFYDKAQWIVYPRSERYLTPEQFKECFKKQGMGMLQFLKEHKFNTIREAVTFILNLYR